VSRSTIAEPAPSAVATTPQARAADPYRLACEVADVLAGMTYQERISAYRNGVLTPHELTVAAARLPDEVPTLNGELEWIAWNLADLD